MVGRKPYSDRVNGSRTNMIHERLLRNWRQKDVAEKMNISRSLYAKIECGEREGNDRFWHSASIIFGMPESYLMFRSHQNHLLK